MGMVDHAKEELKYLRSPSESNESQDWIEKNIIEII